MLAAAAGAGVTMLPRSAKLSPLLQLVPAVHADSTQIATQKPWEVVAQKPPFVLVNNSCEYAEQNEEYSTLDLFVAIPVLETISGTGMEKPTTIEHGPILFRLYCGMKPRAVVDPTRKCIGARLELRPLIEGRPLSPLGLSPFDKDWDNTEFRVAESTGGVVRIVSHVSQKVGPSGYTRQTITADFIAKRVTFHSYSDIGGRIWEKRGEATCETTGWSSTGPEPPWWKKSTDRPKTNK